MMPTGRSFSRMSNAPMFLSAISVSPANTVASGEIDQTRDPLFASTCNIDGIEPLPSALNSDYGEALLRSTTTDIGTMNGVDERTTCQSPAVRLRGEDLSGLPRPSRGDDRHEISHM